MTRATLPWPKWSERPKNSRRAAIVLMSDGLDGSIPGVQGEGSKLSYQELLNGIREFDGVLYTLWLNTYYEALNPQGHSAGSLRHRS